MCVGAERCHVAERRAVESGSFKEGDRLVMAVLAFLHWHLWPRRVKPSRTDMRFNYRFKVRHPQPCGNGGRDANPSCHGKSKRVKLGQCGPLEKGQLMVLVVVVVLAVAMEVLRYSEVSSWVPREAPVCVRVQQAVDRLKPERKKGNKVVKYEHMRADSSAPSRLKLEGKFCISSVRPVKTHW